MQKWHDEILFDFTNPCIQKHFTENALFFDIETTGFSAARTSLYLIGCAARKKDLLIINQFFAETPEEEADVLLAFLDYLKSFDTIITFNGIGFDIPYLKAKCKTFELMDPFDSYTYLDIYKYVSKFKFLLQLPNIKQKTIEGFMGLDRDDLYNGGELIDVYHSYVKTSDEESLFLLKQHNYEDVLGMPSLLPILSYTELLNGNFTVTSIDANQYINYSGLSCKELIFTLKNEFAVPKHISCIYEDFFLMSDGYETKLNIRLFEGELRYFYPNYKDYFYLPDEDIAIHKNIAASIDKEHRKKATAGTCYTRKYAIFLPQHKQIAAPAFRAMYRDKKTYFELSEEFLNSADLQKEYVLHILEYISRQKK